MTMPNDPTPEQTDADTVPEDSPATEPAEAEDQAAEPADTDLTEADEPAAAAPVKPARKPAAPRNADSETAGAPRTGKAVALTVIVALLAVAAAVSTYFALDYRGQARDLQQSAADRARAEEIAGKYGVGASTLDFNDLAPWLRSMKDGVSDELAKKMDGIAETMRQVVTAVRLQSTGKLVVTKVTDEANGVYKVATVVDMSATSVQAPQGTVTTTAYVITVDRNQDWKITDYGNSLGNTPVPVGGAAPAPAQPVPSP
ncbi:hypothetical protein [Tsukamurella strandjordii]|uniref:Mce-associated membrane protein n=1 Tax=Tsukamurella strandjordii TaxID=147577 RepID=A0AA90NFW4_9ACTN|nr:hypothetical protein [Tsukamurella strandjordii]MDP0399672.1 hypothetical protein [Tsukamurella strandjordii]